MRYCTKLKLHLDYTKAPFTFLLFQMRKSCCFILKLESTYWSKIVLVLPVSAAYYWLIFGALLACTSMWVQHCKGRYLSVTAVDQLRRQLAGRFLSAWYYTRSGVGISARKNRFIMNRHSLLSPEQNSLKEIGHTVL